MDKTIRTFDLRNFGQPLQAEPSHCVRVGVSFVVSGFNGRAQILHGHQLAVKRAWAPRVAAVCYERPHGTRHELNKSNSRAKRWNKGCCPKRAFGKNGQLGLYSN